MVDVEDGESAHLGGNSTIPGEKAVDAAPSVEKTMTLAVFDGNDVVDTVSRQLLGWWIERVDIHNFKSYRGHHTIGPFKRFTAIIGPNGAGKSNLMDAVAFVLGLQTRKMRGNVLSDLICYSEGLLDQNHEPSLHGPREASVTITLRHHPKESVVRYSRRLRLSFPTAAEGEQRCHSYFEVDGKVISASDYKHQLASMGILVQARNFLVFQGDVIDVALKSPEELGDLIDQISAGDELRPIVQKLDTDVKRLSAVLRAQTLQRQRYETQRQDLDKQVQEVEAYANLQKELQQAVSQCAGFRLYRNSAQAQAAHARLVQILKEVEDLQRKKTDTTQALRQSDAKLVRLRQTHQKQLEELDADRCILDEQKRNVVLLEERIKCAKDHKSALSVADQKYRLHLEEQRRQQEQLSQELSDTKTLIKTLEQEEDTADAAFHNHKLASFNNEDEHSHLRQKAASQSSHLKTTHMASQSRRKAIETNIQDIEAEIADIQAQIITLKLKSNQCDDAIRQTSLSIEESRDRLTQDDNGIASLLEAIRKTDEEKTTRRSELHELQLVLIQSEAHQGELSRRRKQNNTIQLLQNAFPGKIYGRVTELYRPSRRHYASAITSALGRYNECIVVDTFSTAKMAVAFLKKQSLGVLEFAALDTVFSGTEDRRLRPLIQSLTSSTAPFTLAVDCINHDLRYDKLFHCFLHDTVIVSTIDDATNLAYNTAKERGLRPKVVMLDGTRILKNGNIVVDTPLRSPNPTCTDLKEKRTALAQLEASVMEKQTEINTLQKQLSRATEVRENHDAVLRQQSHQLKGYQLEKASIQEETEALQKCLESRVLTKHNLENRLNQLSEEIQQLEKQIQSIEDDVYGAAAAEIHHFQALQTAYKQTQHDRDKQRALCAARESQIELELQRVDADISATEKQRDQSQRQLEHYIQQIASYTAEKDELHTHITHLASALTQKEAHTAQLLDSITTEDTNVRTLRNDLQELQLRIASLNAIQQHTTLEIESLSREAQHALKEAHLQGIVFPTIRQTPQAPSNPSSAQSTPQQPITPLTKDFFFQTAPYSDIDFDALLTSTMIQAVSPNGSVEQAQQIERQLEEHVGTLRAELSKKCPNMKAKEKYSATLAEIKALEIEITGVKLQRDKLDKKLIAARRQRYRRFITCFRHVQKTTDNIYNTLTGGSSTYHAGGRAFLDFSNDGDILTGQSYQPSVIYNVIPPFKRFCSLRRLSGGEKTMAALALLFGLHSYNASPFFILDEVDADLDPINVLSLAKYLQEAPFQVIVISHSDRVFSQADELLGVYIDLSRESSATLSLDLTPYPRTATA